MAHHYRITVEALDEENTGGPLVFEASNHDELFAIVERLRSKQIVPDDEAPAFAIGLKLFTETMLHHRTLPLFKDLQPAIATFMKALKSTPTA